MHHRAVAARAGVSRQTVSNVLNSPDVTWAGRLVVNPVHRLGVLHAWEIDADGIGRHPVSGAVLTPDTDGQTVDLTLPVGPAEMTITLTVGDAVATGAAPVVTDDAAESAMRTLLATDWDGRLDFVHFAQSPEHQIFADGTDEWVNSA